MIGRQEQPPKVISSASSNSLGSYSLGKQPAKVLQPMVIGKDDLNSTFQAVSIENTQNIETQLLDVNLDLKTEQM